MSDKLTAADVERLVKDPSVEARAETAEKLAVQFESGKLTGDEVKLASEIFRVMVKDAEVRVRTALSRHLSETGALPHDVALSLAKDVDEVSLPMLEFSEVLSDDDLIEIVRTQGEAKQVAIANRPQVSEQVSEALVETDSEKVITNLVSNKGARISESSLDQVVDKFGDSGAVQAGLTQREHLPIGIAERLVARVSEELKAILIKRHDMTTDLADDILDQSRELATLGLIMPWSNEQDVMTLVKALDNGKRLTATIMLRSLCMGDIAFFEAAMSRLSKVSLVNIRLLIHDQGQLGFKAVYKKAGLPENLFPVFSMAIIIFNEMEFDGGAEDQQRFVQRLLERLLTQFEESGGMAVDDIEYLLSKFNKIAAVS